MKGVLRRSFVRGRGAAPRPPVCLDPGCTFMRRMWRQAKWWNGSICFQGHSYCAPQCFERAASLCFAGFCTPALLELPVRHRVPLGLLMLERGQLTNHQLRLALEAQKTNGRGRIGEWLETLGFVTEPQVTAALAVQWACPVFASSSIPDMKAARLLPHRLLFSFRMCPVQFVEQTRTMYVSFSERVDYGALYAIEQMLECRTEPGLVGGRVMDRFLEQLVDERGPGDLLFEGWRDPADMARITCGYVLKFGAEEVRVVRFGSYIWARLKAGRDAANLLFGLPTIASAACDTPFTSYASAKVSAAAGR